MMIDDCIGLPGCGTAVQPDWRFQQQPNRRYSRRFPIVCDVSYRIIKPRSEVIAGRGETLNISSAGVLFTVEHDLRQGIILKLSIAWPAKLADGCLLSLVVTGYLIRQQKQQAAINILKHEFRIRSSGESASTSQELASAVD